MSIASEISRIEGARDAAFAAITDMGGSVPTGSTIDDMASLIRTIPQGGGGGSMDTLWTNTSPSSSFSAKEININDHDVGADVYDFLLIDYIFSTSAQDHSTLLVAVSDLAVTGREYSLRINAASYNRTGARNFRFVYSGTTINYAKLYFAGASYNTSSNNGYVIPYKIYGIKL